MQGVTAHVTVGRRGVERRPRSHRSRRRTHLRRPPGLGTVVLRRPPAVRAPSSLLASAARRRGPPAERRWPNETRIASLLMASPSDAWRGRRRRSTSRARRSRRYRVDGMEVPQQRATPLSATREICHALPSKRRTTPNSPASQMSFASVAHRALGLHVLCSRPRSSTHRRRRAGCRRARDRALARGRPAMTQPAIAVSGWSSPHLHRDTVDATCRDGAVRRRRPPSSPIGDRDAFPGRTPSPALHVGGPRTSRVSSAVGGRTSVRLLPANHVSLADPQSAVALDAARWRRRSRSAITIRTKAEARRAVPEVR